VVGGLAWGVPCGLLNTPRHSTDDPLAAARGFVVERRHPDLGAVRVPGDPFVASQPLLGFRRPAPVLDEGDAVPAGWPAARGRAAGLPAGGDGPLTGLRVLSLGNFVAGNSFAMALAELGAEVIKVESHRRPDPVRARFTADHPETREPSGAETTTLFAGLSRSVRDLSIDLKAPGGTDLFRRLARAADVVFENFGAGALTGLGLGWDQLREVNPRLVMVSVSGYGRTGPRAAYLAYGGNISSFTGLTHLWGQSLGSFYDYIAGTHAVVATLAALAVRDRTGQGTYVDVAQTEAAGAILGPLLLGHLNGGAEAEPPGNCVAGAWLSIVLPCRGDDAWVAVELRGEEDVAALEPLLGGPAPSAPARSADAGTVGALLAAWAADRTAFQAARSLQRAGVPAAVVQDSEDVWRDPQLRDRRSIVAVPHPDLGEHEYPAPPHRLSATPAAIRRPSPRLGADTRDVLARWLGMPDETVAALVEQRTVGTDDPASAT
jgi:crotonobetainyl-CoA:carnitine CoA-transferase CaiB-like acyl-CoA transferase